MSTLFDCIYGTLCLFLYVKVTKSRKSSTDTSVNQEVSKLDCDNYLQKTKKLFKASDQPSSRQKEEEPMESEITGGSSSSRDPIIPKESDDQDAESAKNKSVPNVKGPSRKEREDHEETHCTYRSWCKHCVKGRGREDVHNRKTQDEKLEVPTIAMDYCFMGKKTKSP